jgi:4-amino-4-deoxy-L-arabinose transferase-like glycosyltransferase
MRLPALKERTGLLMWLIFATAFLDRFLVRIWYGENYFWKHSYSLFYELAQSVVAGRGLRYEWLGVKWAQRPPIYPLLLTVSILGGKPYVTIVILQSLIGGATAFCTFLIGRELFDKWVGLLAAMGVAIYPYFVMHDTALQETGLFTFLTALAILLLLKSRHTSSIVVWAASGAVLALAALTRATLLVFVPFALIWVLFFARKTRTVALQKCCVIGMAFLLLVGPWILRNYIILRRPTFSTLTGLTLWAGNNPYTFTQYPTRSIDLSVNIAIDNLGENERNEMQELSKDEVAQNSWFIQKAINYIKGYPRESFVRSLQKVGAGFSWRQNPQSERFAQMVYFLSYSPVLILGIAGALIARKDWRKHIIVYALFLSFISVTAIFFAHTSHRSYLDVYLLVFSAKAISTSYQFFKPRVAPVEERSVGLQ